MGLLQRFRENDDQHAHYGLNVGVGNDAAEPGFHCGEGPLHTPFDLRRYQAGLTFHLGLELRRGGHKLHQLSDDVLFHLQYRLESTLRASKAQENPIGVSGIEKAPPAGIELFGYGEQ